MLQYKIPQNVGIEDKIVGPFSLRQLIILAVGGGISYVLFAITSRIYELNVLEYILIAFPALFALAAAMLKIHNVTFIKYLMLLLEFAIKPKKRMWNHRGISALVDPDLRDQAAAKKNEGKAQEADKSRKNVNLRDLSVTLDSGGFEHIEQVKHEDIDEANDDDLITEAYFGHKQTESDTQNMYWRTRDMQKKKLDLLAKMKQATAAPQPAVVPVQTNPMQTTQNQAPAKQPVTTVSPAAIKAEMPATENKESVAEHLASVIKEARQNNQAKNEVQENQAAQVKEGEIKQNENKAKPEPTAKTEAQKQTPVRQSTETEPPKPKKKRKRKRKKKPTAGPVRNDTLVDTTSKSKPVKLINKNEKQGETSFDDLSGGDEIEFNLD